MPTSVVPIEQHDEAAEQQHVGQAGQAAPHNAALQQHIAHQPADGTSPVDALACSAVPCRHSRTRRTMP